MPFIYQNDDLSESAKQGACCDADAAVESGPCCDKNTGATTVDPNKVCCDKSPEPAEDAPKASGCCG